MAERLKSFDLGAKTRASFSKLRRGAVREIYITRGAHGLFVFQRGHVATAVVPVVSFLFIADVMIPVLHWTGCLILLFRRCSVECAVDPNQQQTTFVQSAKLKIGNIYVVKHKEPTKRQDSAGELQVFHRAVRFETQSFLCMSLLL